MAWRRRLPSGERTSEPASSSFPSPASHRRWSGDPLLIGSGLISALAFLGVTMAVVVGRGATGLDLFLLEVLTRELVGSLAGLGWLTWLASPHLYQGAFVALFAYFASRETWDKAYLSLAIGPGGSALVYLVQILVRRVPPQGTPSRMIFSGYPDATAALIPCLALTLVVLFARRVDAPRLGGTLAVSAALPLVVSAPHLFTTVWPTDLFAGIALGVGWFGACVAGYAVATGRGLDTSDVTDPAQDAPGWGVLEPALSLLRRKLILAWGWIDRHLVRIETLYVLIALGVGVRISTYWTYQIGFDAHIYAVMAESIAEHGSLTMPWGTIYSFTGEAAPSHHYPPLYPAIVAGFYELFGVGPHSLHLASIATSLLLLGVAYVCSRDLYGHRAALITTALLSLYPVLVKNTGEAYSENLVLVTFVLTMWGILRSLEDARFIVPAGLFAGLGYLAKSSMGYFFFIAGGAGFLWRLYWMRWELFKDRYYWIAVGIFGSLVAAWAGRNWITYGSWQTSEHLAHAYQHAVANLAAYATNLPIVFLFLLGFGYLVMMGLFSWFPSLSKISLLDDEHDSGLWLAFGLPLVLSTFVYAALWTLEGFFYVGAVRYVAPALVPAAWLLLRHVDLEATQPRIAAFLTFAVLAGGTAAYAVPYQPLYDDAPEELGARYQPGETIAFAGLDGHGMYRFYLEVTENGTREAQVEPVELPVPAGTDARWLVTKGREVQPPDAYEIVGRYRVQEERLEPIVLWERTEPPAAASVSR